MQGCRLRKGLFRTATFKMNRKLVKLRVGFIGSRRRKNIVAQVRAKAMLSAPPPVEKVRLFAGFVG
jgi:hypothetical protein